MAWDDRPARWLHRPDSAWLLFGVCSCIAGPCEIVENTTDSNSLNLDAEVVVEDDVSSEEKVKYRVTGA